MNFIDEHKNNVHGILHGFDRLIFRGYLSSFFSEKGMYYYMSQTQVKLTGFKSFMERQQKKLRQHITQIAQTEGVQIHYINNSKESKEDRAKKDFSKDPAKHGLISIISTQESAYTYRLVGNKARKELEVIRQMRPHLHYYLYYNDEEFGWMHVKIQSWYPFTMQFYVNGKEYLKRCLTKANIEFNAYDNSITWVKELEKAQAFADQLVNKKWDRFFNAFAQRINPFLSQIAQVFQGKGYSWCLHQSEYATDVLFKNRNYLERLYPSILQKATMFKGGEDIYSFFGRNLTHRSTKQVTGSNKRFIQGFRVKHYLDKNSVKMYDKSSVLRVETTINNSRSFKIYKEVERKGKKTMAWVPMGKAVSNLYRCAQIAKACNLRYLNSLAQIKLPKNWDKKVEQISTNTSQKNRNNNTVRYSAFNLLSKETCLILEAISDGKFDLQPFSNKMLRQLLIEKKLFQIDLNDSFAIKRLSGKITRLIAKLRAHKMVCKISNSFKYKLTKLGRNICYKVLKFKKIELIAN